MVLNTIFIASGLVVAALIAAKMIEERRKKKPLLLRLVSLGDERVRSFSHGFTHKYSELKERSLIYLKNQLPLRSKNIMNKAQTAIKEKAEQYIGNIRDSRLLKKNEGISEYFKNLSEKENGRIDDSVAGGSQEPDSEVK